MDRSKPNLEDNLKFNSKQMGAIKFQMQRGYELQNLHPEIAEDYRVGLSLVDLAKKYCVREKFGLINKNGRMQEYIVYRALTGNNSPKLGKVFPGLISEEEKTKIAHEHKIKLGKIIGRQSCEEKKGIHAYTTDERKEIGRRAGKKTAQISKEKGVGLFGWSIEQRKAYGKIAAIKSGKVPWEEGEILLAYILTKVPQYKNPRGNYGRYGQSNKKIAEGLNQIYHRGKSVRNAHSANWMFGYKHDDIEKIRQKYFDYPNSIK